MKVSLILACAGKGIRAKLSCNKILYNFDNGDETLPVFMHCLKRFTDSKLIDEYIVVASEQDYDNIKRLVPSYCKVVYGGETRSISVFNGLNEAIKNAEDEDIVLIHDGARPFVNKRIIEDCIVSAKKYGSAITAIPSSDTVFACENDTVKEYLGKSGLYLVQTPQAFNLKQIFKAYKKAFETGHACFNDDGEVYKRYSGELHIIGGDSNNVKLTYKNDFDLLDAKIIKTGVGYDCHRLVEGRKLILGGIEIEHNKGLLGHSDADVLTHAIMDAILSACSMRDIGYFFPDTDAKYKDADSIVLLKTVLNMIRDSGYKVISVSACIMAEKPKLLKYIPEIRENLSKTIGIGIDDIGIGATTLEGLGFVGREEGICVHANANVIKICNF